MGIYTGSKLSKSICTSSPSKNDDSCSMSIVFLMPEVIVSVANMALTPSLCSSVLFDEAAIADVEIQTVKRTAKILTISLFML